MIKKRAVYELKNGTKATYISGDDIWRMYAHATRSNPFDLGTPFLIGGLIANGLAALALASLPVLLMWLLAGQLVQALYRIELRHWQDVVGLRERKLLEDNPDHTNNELRFYVYTAFGIVVNVLFFMFVIWQRFIVDPAWAVIGGMLYIGAMFQYVEMVRCMSRIQYRYMPLIYNKFGGSILETELEFVRRMDRIGAHETIVNENDIDLTLNDVPAFDNPNRENHALQQGSLTADVRRMAGQKTPKQVDEYKRGSEKKQQIAIDTQISAYRAQRRAEYFDGRKTHDED